MATRKDAERPTAADGTQYHLGTAKGSLAPRCLLVGAPERATLIATRLMRNARKVGEHRGFLSYTGTHNGTDVSVVTTGMGGPSIGIVLPEAVASGAKEFIRVGSCGALLKDVRVGELIIATGAVRLDGASENWAPMEYPAVPDWRIVADLKKAAVMNGMVHRTGIGITTSCFYEGQARPDPLSGYVPDRLLRRHDELVRRGAIFYAMEEAALFVWCSTHGGIPCGAIDTVYANRETGDFHAGGDEDAAKVALDAIVKPRI